MIPRPWEFGSVLGARLVGAAFKEISTAVDQAIGGQVVDDHWARIYDMFAKAYKEAFAASTSDESKGVFDDSFDKAD